MKITLAGRVVFEGYSRNIADSQSIIREAYEHTMMDIVKLAIAPGLLLMVAENVPKLNVVPSCQTAGRESIVAGRNFYTCVADEHAARDKLGTIWHYYTPVEKSQCTQTTSIGGSPSYIELTVCLEFMKEARERKALIPAVRER